MKKQKIAPRLALGALVGLAGLTTACASSSSALVSLARHDAACAVDAPSVERLRVASYNIRSGRSSSIDDIAEVLRDLDADVIALQEVQRNVDAEAPVDQIRELAAALGMSSAYAPAKRKGDGDFGVAVLSRLPIAQAERVPLQARFSGEPRVALDATVCAADRSLRFIAVHSDVLPWSAADGTSYVAELAGSSVGEGVIVAGDLNMTPGETGPRALSRKGLIDVVGQHAEGPTFPGGVARRLDYLFLDGPLAKLVSNVRIHNTPASDHFPVLADIDLSRWAR
jgi:endonuclease/exonuclease/phosphatase family metal-dependent hydrolase